MTSYMKKSLLNALKKYGVTESICQDDDLKGDWDKFATEETVKVSLPSDIDLRHRLINQGRILEENLDEHYYYWLVKLNGLFAPEALVVTIRDENEVQIGAFSKEGLLSKGTASRAIEQIKVALQK